MLPPFSELLKNLLPFWAILFVRSSSNMSCCHNNGEYHHHWHNNLFLGIVLEVHNWIKFNRLGFYFVCSIYKLKIILYIFCTGLPLLFYFIGEKSCLRSLHHLPAFLLIYIFVIIKLVLSRMWLFLNSLFFSEAGF